MWFRKSVQAEEPLERQAEFNENGSALTDYNLYRMSRNEKTMYILFAVIAIYTAGYIFYRSLPGALILCPLAFLYPKIRTKEIIEQRKKELNIQFKDMLYSLSSSLSAGKSVETAFRDVLKDLSILYPDPNTHMIREVEYIIRKIEMNESIEDALKNFALRSHLEDVESFSDVFYTCKRTGGNIVDIIRNTSNIIGDKVEIQQEIATLLASRKFEQKVLNLMPVFMMLILSMSAGDYMYPVFHTVAGRVVMTIAIGFLAVAYFVSKRIMDIQV